MATEITVEDIAALRTQGQDFREYLRLRLAASQPVQPPQQAAAPASYGPLHRPGSWPAGTRSTGSTCHPDCDCALTRHTPKGANQ